MRNQDMMRNVGLDEAQAEIKISRRNINNLRYPDDTTLMAESEEELKSLLMKVKEESEKVGFKLNIHREGNGTHSSILGKFHGQRNLVGCSPWGYITEHTCMMVEGDGLVAINW